MQNVRRRLVMNAESLNQVIISPPRNRRRIDSDESTLYVASDGDSSDDDFSLNRFGQAIRRAVISSDDETSGAGPPPSPDSSEYENEEEEQQVEQMPGVEQEPVQDVVVVQALDVEQAPVQVVVVQASGVEQAPVQDVVVQAPTVVQAANVIQASEQASGMLVLSERNERNRLTEGLSQMSFLLSELMKTFKGLRTPVDFNLNAAPPYVNHPSRRYRQHMNEQITFHINDADRGLVMHPDLAAYAGRNHDYDTMTLDEKFHLLLVRLDSLRIHTGISINQLGVLEPPEMGDVFRIECPICMKKIKPTRAAVVPPQCGHIFCAPCAPNIQPTRAESRFSLTCPMCRSLFHEVRSLVKLYFRFNIDGRPCCRRCGVPFTPEGDLFRLKCGDVYCGNCAIGLSTNEGVCYGCNMPFSPLNPPIEILPNWK